MSQEAIHTIEEWGMDQKLTHHLSAAQALLKPGETHVPESVVGTIRFLTSKGIWFQLSRNLKAESCADAAHKRSRLGHEGIPLWDELKSFLGSYIDQEGCIRLVIAHCRGDERLNMEALAHTLRAKHLPIRLEEEELSSIGSDYGLVNPFTFSRSVTTIAKDWLIPAQVFDKGLLHTMGVPGTVMTNAGDFTWAVEFYLSELVGLIPKAIVASIAESNLEEPTHRWNAKEHLAVGIITGNGPESGISLWNHINAEVRRLLGPECLGDVSMPRILVHSLPEMGLSMELDTRTDQVWNAIESAVKNMCQEGVRLITLACNTTHYFTPRIQSICSEYGAEFISMPECVGAWLQARDVEHVALLGIRYVTELDKWSAYREPLKNMKVERLDERGIDLIHDLAYRVKTEGATPGALSRFRDILQQQISARYVVVALTELSLLLRQKWRGENGKILVDPLAIYGKAIARRYLGLSLLDTPSKY